MGMGFFLQKERIFPGAHKIGTAISGPRIAGNKFDEHEDFSEIGKPLKTCTCFVVAVSSEVHLPNRSFPCHAER